MTHHDGRSHETNGMKKLGKEVMYNMIQINEETFTSIAIAVYYALDIITRLPRTSDDLTFKVCENLSPNTEGCFQLTPAMKLTGLNVAGTIAFLIERTVPSVIVLYIEGKQVLEVRITGKERG